MIQSPDKGKIGQGLFTSDSKELKWASLWASVKPCIQVFPGYIPVRAMGFWTTFPLINMLKTIIIEDINLFKIASGKRKNKIFFVVGLGYILQAVVDVLANLCKQVRNYQIISILPLTFTSSSSLTGQLDRQCQIACAYANKIIKWSSYLHY